MERHLQLGCLHTETSFCLKEIRQWSLCENSLLLRMLSALLPLGQDKLENRKQNRTLFCSII